MGKKTGSWDQGPKTAMDEEYLSLMAELGEGPGPAAPPSAPNSGPKEDKQAWRGNNSGGGPGRNMFQGGPPRHPRPLMGPGGPRGGPPPPPGTNSNLSNYRTRAIISRSRFEAALVYKPRILSFKKSLVIQATLQHK